MITLFNHTYYTFVSTRKATALNERVKTNSKADTVRKDIGDEAFEYISKFFVFDSYTKVLATSTRFNIETINDDFYNTIINLKQINDYSAINDIIVTINQKLRTGGKFIGCIETKDLRKARLLKKFPKPLNWMYYTGDFVFKRIFPKFQFTRKIYKWLTNDRNRVITKTEMLGRLAYCNFNIISEQTVGNKLYFVAEKMGEVCEKALKNPDPHYGLIIRLKRVGKDGKKFNVYKIRTMHPFAEYIQEYVYRNNHLDKGGKFKDDFRISTWGRVLRKFWIDELPMLVNLLRGDLKIVGVRPLSSQYFGLYTDELKEKRVKYKPGLIPPFYADMPETLDEIIQSEIKYLNQYDKNPIKTDVKYFLCAMKNILFRNKRSK